MRYQVLVTDYDGTLAHDGRVGRAAVDALERLRRSGRAALLVTGRQLPDLRETFDRLDLFGHVVAENGALLYDPAADREQLLTEPADPRLVDELQRRKIEPLSLGRAIVATSEPNATLVLEAIHTLGLELEIIFNKGAVMVLPSGVNKATGMAAALHSLGLSARDAVGIGDAENDQPFLSVCAVSVAVANALPSLKERADVVTAGRDGEGVAELVDRLIEDDLALHSRRSKAASSPHTHGGSCRQGA